MSAVVMDGKGLAAEIKAGSPETMRRPVPATPSGGGAGGGRSRLGGVCAQ